ncbi:MAG: hypothetical protein M3R51_03765 [Candidatus Eremiobacteraeota bacterium]|nr:hypothetical protein [Candidatus Eremiobacteraeota bacterium]
MITESGETSRGERVRLLWALAASAILNLFLWIAATDFAGAPVHLVQPNEREKLLVASTSVRIEHRTIPQPQREPARSAPAPSSAQVREAAKRRPPAHRREIAREEENAEPQPPVAPKPATLAQTLAAQEREFARESRALHASNNPLSIATIAPRPPASYQRSYMDLSGRDRENRIAAVLRVLSKFATNTMHCYYVHYDAQFSSGGTDAGNIPWPICYPKDRDAMLPLDRVHVLPIPVPPPGYVLPAGVELSPLLHDIYTGKIHA